MVTETSAVLDVQGAVPVMVQRSTIGPAPPVWVKVLFGSFASLKVPVPPLTMLQVPVPRLGVLPPRLVVPVFAQISWGPPTVAAVGGVVTCKGAVLLTLAQGPTPSGSSVVQVNVNAVPTSLMSGVYVVLALVVLPKVPAPPLHEPVPLELAVMFTAVVPHVV
jgi:hypothetical protein